MENKEIEVLVNRLEESNKQLQETIIKAHNKKINFIICLFITLLCFYFIPIVYTAEALSRTGNLTSMFLFLIGVIILWIATGINYMTITTTTLNNQQYKLPDNVIRYK